MSRRTQRGAPREPHRPLALTTEIETRLLNNIAAGVPLEHAARAAGLSSSTYFRYMQRGEDAAARHADGEHLDDDDLRLMEFWERASRARSESVATSVVQIQRAAQGGYLLKEVTKTYRDAATGQMVTEHEKSYAPVDWRAAAFLLERRDRANFGRSLLPPEAAGSDGQDGGPAEVTAGEIRDLATRVTDNIHRVMSERAEQAALMAGSGPVIAGEVVRLDG
jgi:hypothetical protein